MNKKTIGVGVVALIIGLGCALSDATEWFPGAQALAVCTALGGLVCVIMGLIQQEKDVVVPVVQPPTTGNRKQRRDVLREERRREKLEAERSPEEHA